MFWVAVHNHSFGSKQNSAIINISIWIVIDFCLLLYYKLTLVNNVLSEMVALRWDTMSHSSWKLQEILDWCFYFHANHDTLSFVFQWVICCGNILVASSSEIPSMAITVFIADSLCGGNKRELVLGRGILFSLRPFYLFRWIRCSHYGVLTIWSPSYGRRREQLCWSTSNRSYSPVRKK